MGNETIELSFLSIFTLITFFIFFFVSKYSFKFKNGILLDEDFSKPQACGLEKSSSKSIPFLNLKEYLLTKKNIKKVIKVKIDKKLNSIVSLPIIYTFVVFFKNINTY